TLSTGAGWRREGSPAAYVYEVATGLPAAPPLEGDGVLTDAVLSPDGRAAATLHSAASSDEQRFSRLVEPEGRAGGLQPWGWRRGQARVPRPAEAIGAARRHVLARRQAGGGHRRRRPAAGDRSRHGQGEDEAGARLRALLVQHLSRRALHPRRPEPRILGPR